MEKIRAQPGFIAERDIFTVALDNDLEGDPAVDQSDKKRRHLRYRAASEYIATHSDLLIAIHDLNDPSGNPDDSSSAGTTTIIETKRRGPSFELLAQANNFSWADNGPVLRIPIQRQKHAALPALPTQPMALLHPYDTIPFEHQVGVPASSRRAKSRDRGICLNQRRRQR